MRAMIAVLAALLAATAWAAADLSKEELAAQFYADLGSAEVDVSGYPDKQKKNYAVFQKTCSQCHTLARPINSPLSARADWKRYIKRMTQRSAGRDGKTIAARDRAPILEFLVYDSSKRKVEGAADFKALTERLKSRFAAVQAENQRLRLEKDESNKRTPAPYTGDK